MNHRSAFGISTACLLLGFCVATLAPARADEYRLTRSGARLVWNSSNPGSLQITPVPLSRLGGTWFEGQIKTTPVSIWVSQRPVRLPPTARTVGSQWKKTAEPLYRGLASATDSEVRDLGCARIGSAHYACEMEIRQDRRYTRSRLIWRGRETLLVQSSSRESAERARDALQALQVRFP